MPTPEHVGSWRDQEGGETTDLAQAYRDLARGEHAAAALESKIDAMLDDFDAKQTADKTNHDKPANEPDDGKTQPGHGDHHRHQQ